MPEWTAEPVSQMVANDLRGRIASDEFEVGAQLPSVSRLTKEYADRGVPATLGTVRSAIAKLREDGLVVSYQGKGAFVRAKPEAGSPEYREIMSAMTELREAMDQAVSTINERLDRLEQGEGHPPPTA